MRYIFKSDKFNLIHPSLNPRKYGEYSNKEREEAIENTMKIHYDKDIFDKANENANGCIPDSQIGSIIVFPYSTREDGAEIPNSKGLIDVVKFTYEKTAYKLLSEYADFTDPFKFYDVDNTGKYFGATFKNTIRNCKETFNPKSITLFVAGCKNFTAEYIFEEFLETCYIEADKRDRKTIKNGEPEENRFRMNLIHTFLTYNFAEKKFRQFGIKEGQLYSEIWATPKVRDVGLPEYRVVQSISDESFD